LEKRCFQKLPNYDDKQPGFGSEKFRYGNIVARVPHSGGTGVYYFSRLRELDYQIKMFRLNVIRLSYQLKIGHFFHSARSIYMPLYRDIARPVYVKNGLLICASVVLRSLHRQDD